MDWEFVREYLMPPLVGGVIGLVTNYIAVKMIFVPRTEKRIFGFRVPFTPGAIPKGKKRFAKSAGKIVANQLFTKEDISNKMLTEEIEKPLIDRMMDILSEDIRDTGKILAGSGEKYDELEKSFTELLTVKIIEAIKNMDIPEIIRVEGGRITNESLSTSKFLRLVVSDKLVDRIMKNVSDKMEIFIDTGAVDMVGDITGSRIHDLGERTPLHVLEQAGYDKEYVRNKLIEVYRESVVNAVNSALRRINVASIVEDKINSMSVMELEKGVLSVMKTELDMIVNLGGLIGLVIGCINIII